MRKWCSFVHLIPFFGEWFEKRYGPACQAHDLCCADATIDREIGLYEFLDAEVCHFCFFLMMCRRGPFDFLLAVPVFILMIPFYWLNRFRKWIIGEVPHP